MSQKVQKLRKTMKTNEQKPSNEMTGIGIGNDNDSFQ